VEAVGEHGKLLNGIADGARWRWKPLEMRRTAAWGVGASSGFGGSAAGDEEDGSAGAKRMPQRWAVLSWAVEDSSGDTTHLCHVR
jgi:hypothetical protein